MRGPRIGDLQLENPLIMAPMASITDNAFRIIVKRHGAALVFSEMISSVALVRGNRERALRDAIPTDEERPFGIQLFGPDPESMAEAARIVEELCDLIDINLGCPARKVVAKPTPAGAGLLKYPKRVEAIIKAVVKAVSKPVIVKMRAGWDSSSVNYLLIGRIAEESGASAVTLHPRTRAQGFSGKADWSMIAWLKESLSIPVIGNGDVFGPENAVRMIREIGCDGVMIARGALGNPWIFSRTLSYLESGELPPEPTVEERFETLLELMRLMIKFKGEERAALEIRKHAGWFVKGLPNAKLLRVKAQQVRSYSELESLLKSYLAHHSHSWGCHNISSVMPS